MLWIAGGGAAGAICRYVLGSLFTKKIKTRFPLAIMVINLLGSFGLGIVLAVADADSMFLGQGASEPFYLTLGVGFLGAFTTFSTFSVEAVELLRQKAYRMAFIYIFLTLLGSLLFFLLGYHVV